MQRDRIAFPQQRGKIDRFGSAFADLIVAEPGIVGDDLKSDPLSLASHLAADAAIAKHAERLPFQAADGVLRLQILPVAAINEIEMLLEIALKREQQGQRVGGNFINSIVGHIGDPDARRSAAASKSIASYPVPSRLTILQRCIVAIISAVTGCNATISASQVATAARPSGESRSGTLTASMPPASANTASSIAACSRLACASTTIAIPTPLVSG